MATQQKTTGLTYADLEAFPDDNLRRELIDGELIVTAAPRLHHQRIVVRLAGALLTWTHANGGEVFPAPADVLLSDADVVEPDVVFVSPDNLTILEDRFVRGAPDIAIEVSSPSTRQLEVIRKRDLYERYGVPEYWYVDLEVDRVEMYRLSEGGYGAPEILGRNDEITSPALARFALSIDELLVAPTD